MFDPRLDTLKNHNNSPWAMRLLYQLEFAHEISKVDGRAYDALIDQAIALAADLDQQEGLLTQAAVRQVETLIAPLSPHAKRYTVLCVAHAHIDMNWMWRFDETVAITLDTMRTMLDLMKEYPAYKFSQSQASVYQIVETYAPELLEEIRARVKEGRWEVTASTWVEGDKNMPNAESQARHLLYTRQYLTRLLDLKPDHFHIDFEPDTFGHALNVPEILSSGGVRHYYHCRGDQGPVLYRWQAPSGNSILVYRDPYWYGTYVEPDWVMFVPAVCQEYGMNTALRMYGVGDHGGGPTRRDLERIQDMATWPVYPDMRFGTFGEFFAAAEKVADRLPVVKQELNFIFPGCYTTQTRIKRANRLSEAALYSSETFRAISALQGQSYPGVEFARAWQNALFSHFHDILTGSGIIDTREYALGKFQETLAIATSARSQAFQFLTRPTEPGSNLPTSIAEGAGVGFGVAEFRLPQVSRSGARQRLFHIFNPSPWPRQQVVEVTVWDWDGDLQRLVFQDETGAIRRHQVLDKGFNDYWGHKFLRVLVEAQAPACGYGSLLLTESEAILDNMLLPLDFRVEIPEPLVLENEHLRATFDTSSCALVSLVEKASNTELIDPQRPAVFRRIQEDDKVMGTAWVIGRYMDIQPYDTNVQVFKYEHTGALRQSLTFETARGATRLNVTVSLEAGSRQLEVTAEVDWHELGRKGGPGVHNLGGIQTGIPQLNFIVPLAYDCPAYRYDIPAGAITRPPLDLDVPGVSWAMAQPQNPQKPGVQLITEAKYGFRGVDNSLALTLIRSSIDPDPYPELGLHRIRFAICVADGAASNQALIHHGYNYTHPLEVYSSSGATPSQSSFLILESGSVAISAIKAPENSGKNEIILRLYETDGQATQAVLHFDRPVTHASWVDTHEQPTDGGAITIDGQTLRLNLAPYRLAALRISF